MCIVRPPRRIIEAQAQPQRDTRAEQDARALQLAMMASRRQNDALVAQLEQQRRDAEAQTWLRRQELAAEQAALQSARGQQQQGAYASMTQASPTDGAMVTTAAAPKRKQRETLKILSPSRTGTGAGLNLGV